MFVTVDTTRLRGLYMFVLIAENWSFFIKMVGRNVGKKKPQVIPIKNGERLIGFIFICNIFFLRI